MFDKTIDSKSTYDHDGILAKDLTEPIFKSNRTDGLSLINYYRVSKEMQMRPDLLSYAAYGEMNYSEIILKESGLDNPFAIEVNDILYVPVLSTVYSNVKDLEEFSNDDGYRNGAADKMSNYDLVANYHKYIDKSKAPKETGSTAVNANIPSSSSSIDPNLLSSNFTGVTSSGKQFGGDYGLGSNGIGGSVIGYDGDGNEIYSDSNGSNSGGSVSGNGGGGKSPVEANMANRGKSGIYVSNGKIYFGNNVSASADDVMDIAGSNDVENELVDCAKNGVTLGQFLNATIKNSIK